jgi:hypothetical protein
MHVRSLKYGLLLAVCAGLAISADNDKDAFKTKPAAEYPHRQTSDKVTIAIQPFTTDDQAKEAFGKLNPWRHGVLPVLVVIQNDGKDAIRLDHAKFVYVLPGNGRVDATPATDVKYIEGGQQPKTINGPIGIHVRKGKSPLGEWEIEGRALSAKMIPAGQSASGFVYFQTPSTSEAATVYISGIVNAATNNELIYFEIPVN